MFFPSPFFLIHFLKQQFILRPAPNHYPLSSHAPHVLFRSKIFFIVSIISEYSIICNSGHDPWPFTIIIFLLFLACFMITLLYDYTSIFCCIHVTYMRLEHMFSLLFSFLLPPMVQKQETFPPGCSSCCLTWPPHTLPSLPTFFISSLLWIMRGIQFHPLPSFAVTSWMVTSSAGTVILIPPPIFPHVLVLPQLLAHS